MKPQTKTEINLNVRDYLKKEFPDLRFPEEDEVISVHCHNWNKFPNKLKEALKKMIEIASKKQDKQYSEVKGIFTNPYAD